MLVAILTSTALTALALMLAFPRTPTGRWLHRMLVEAPARYLLDLTWAKIGKGFVVGIAIAVFAIASPEMLAILAVTGLDAAALLELMIVIWLVSLSGGVTGARRTITRLAAGTARLMRTVARPRTRARSTRPKRPSSQHKNDDSPEPGWAFA